MHPSSLFVGIDVAKAKLDITLRPRDQTWQIDHDEATMAQLVEQLQAQSPTRIVVEATGGLEAPLVAALAAQELPVVVINPRLARDFAEALGYVAKTDRLDAQVLAHYGEAVRRCGPCPMRRRRSCGLWWSDAVNCWRCWAPSTTV